MTEAFLFIDQLGILQINFWQYRRGKILKVMTIGKFINTSPAPFHWTIGSKEPGNILPPICLTASAYFLNTKSKNSLFDKMQNFLLRRSQTVWTVFLVVIPLNCCRWSKKCVQLVWKLLVHAKLFASFKVAKNIEMKLVGRGGVANRVKIRSRSLEPKPGFQKASILI